MSKKEFDLKYYNDVIAFMKSAHGEQMRAFTKVPYWTHPIRVANLLMKFKESHKMDELVIAALLHDVVEDTWVPLSTVRTIYGDLVGNLVEELTSDKKAVKEKGKTAYLLDKMIHMSSWGLVIKLCDRLDNVTDFVFAPERFIERYGKETHEIIHGLQKERKLSDTQESIVDAIMMNMNVYYEVHHLFEGGITSI